MGWGRSAHHGGRGAGPVHLHSSLAMTVQGVPLGFVDVQCWARDVRPFPLGRRRQLQRLKGAQPRSPQETLTAQESTLNTSSPPAASA